MISSLDFLKFNFGAKFYFHHFQFFFLEERERIARFQHKKRKLVIDTYFDHKMIKNGVNMFHYVRGVL
jgi:hypothetical protein